VNQQLNPSVGVFGQTIRFIDQPAIRCACGLQKQFFHPRDVIAVRAVSTTDKFFSDLAKYENRYVLAVVRSLVGSQSPLLFFCGNSPARRYGV